MARYLASTGGPLGVEWLIRGWEGVCKGVMFMVLVRKRHATSMFVITLTIWHMYHHWLLFHMLLYIFSTFSSGFTFRNIIWIYLWGVLKRGFVPSSWHIYTIYNTFHQNLNRQNSRYAFKLKVSCFDWIFLHDIESTTCCVTPCHFHGLWDKPFFQRFQSSKFTALNGRRQLAPNLTSGYPIDPLIRWNIVVSGFHIIDGF